MIEMFISTFNKTYQQVNGRIMNIRAGWGEGGRDISMWVMS